LILFHERTVMSEKPEADEFEEADDDALDIEGGDEVDLARLTKDMDHARRRGAAKNCVPAWRKLELLAEQRRTAELTSDFEDYDIDEPRLARRRSTA
jgi:hypothetical protein